MIIDFDLETFRKNLVNIRHILGITAKELGEKIGVTRQTINNIESGRNKLNLTQFLAIKYVFEHELEVTDAQEKIIRHIINDENVTEIIVNGRFIKV